MKIQKEGDFLHNMNVIKEGKGTVIPKYRTKSDKVGNLLACSFCKGLYQKRVLFAHAKTCCLKPQNQSLKKGEARKNGCLLPVPDSIDPHFHREVVSRMRADSVKEIVMMDFLILEYGKRLFYRRDIEELCPTPVSTSRMRH